MICDNCKFEISNNNYQKHIKNCDGLGPRNKRPKTRIGRGGWNKGLNNNDPRVKRISELVSKTLTGRIGHKHTIESKDKIRAAAIKNKLGGHTSKKAIYYKCINGSEIYLQSNYEVKVAESLDLNNIKWIRPKYFNWIDNNGIKHRYYADFYLIDYNVYLDPKNDYLIIKDLDKINRVNEQNKIKILILNKTQLEWNTIKTLI